MPIATQYPRLARLLEQRCFLLFWALLAMLIAMPFLVDTLHGRGAIGILNVTILVTAVAAVQRSKLLLGIAILLGVPAFALQVVAMRSGTLEQFALSWGFNAAFYAFTIGNLLRYVLRQGAMTADKLYGAVAAYLMIAILGAFLHGVLQYLYPGAYSYQGAVKTLDLAELIFFSFTVLTTAGFGDITPNLIQSRFLTMIEAVTGVMYVAILIARLTGVYPVVGTKS